ncbi:MAG: hypothetical protein R3E66_12665 [bacterium]
MKWMLALALIAAASCSDDDATSTQDDMDIRNEFDMGVQADVAVDQNTSQPDVSVTPDMAVDMPVDMDPTVCRVPAAANRVRKLVVARPYDDDANSSPVYVIHQVTTEGVIEQPYTQFELGRAFDGKIQFTPDGEVGFVRLDDGKIGIFRILPNGDVEVIEQGFQASQYASSILIDPTGEYLYMINSGFRNVNGGVYRAKIDCKTGELTDEGLVAPAKLAYGMAFVSPEQAFVEAVDFGDSEEPNHVHEISIGDTLTRVASGSAFTTEDVGLAGFALSNDAKYAIVGDAGLFSNHSISVVSLTGQIAQVQNFPVVDPQDAVFSPFGNAAIVISSQGDNIQVYDVNTSSAQPLTLRGNLQRQEATLLPTDAVMITRGDLNGHVFVSENVAIRRIKFEASGAVTDLGLTPNGEGLSAIPGAIGIQP